VIFYREASTFAGSAGVLDLDPDLELLVEDEDPVGLGTDAGVGLGVTTTGALASVELAALA